MLERRAGIAGRQRELVAGRAQATDNEIRFTADPQEAQSFNRNFEQLWNRPTNIRVQ